MFGLGVFNKRRGAAMSGRGVIHLCDRTWSFFIAHFQMTRRRGAMVQISLLSGYVRGVLVE